SAQPSAVKPRVGPSRPHWTAKRSPWPRALSATSARFITGLSAIANLLGKGRAALPKFKCPGGASPVTLPALTASAERADVTMMSPPSKSQPQPAGADLEPLYFARPSAQYQAMREEINAAIQRVLDGHVYILGKEVERFETGFAAHAGAAHAIGVA